MVYYNHGTNIHDMYHPIQPIMWNVVISERILSFCIGRIIHAWQRRRTTPFVIADSLLLDAHSNTSFIRTHTYPGTTHMTTYTHNWIRTHTYTILAHLHTWFLAFRYNTSPSIRLLRVWLNTHAKSWHINDTMIVLYIPNAIGTNRYQVNIMSITTNNDIIQSVSFDSKYIPNQHHSACLDLLDPTGLPWHQYYDISGRPHLELEHYMTQGTPALTFPLPIPSHAFNSICSTFATPIAQLPHNRQRMIVVIVDRTFNRTHFVMAGEYASTPPTSLLSRHYGYSVLRTSCARRGYNTRHTRTDDHQADIFLTFPFAQHTRSGIPTRFDELLLSYQNRPVLTHQDILDDNDTNMNIRRPVEILIQRCGTSPMTSPLNTSTHRR